MPAATERHAVDWREVTPRILELHDLLSQRNLRARRVAETLEARVAGTPLAAPYAAVVEAVRALSFEAALQALHNLPTEAPPNPDTASDQTTP